MAFKPTWTMVARISAAILLFAALGRHPYGFYTLLRWVVCGAGSYFAFDSAAMKREGWATFGIVAFIFNPFLPVRLDRATWQWVDFVTALLFVGSLVPVRPKTT